MSVLFYDKELMELMENFYILTGIRIVLFDKNFTEIVSHPAGKETFCSYMRKNKDFIEKCHKSDIEAFNKCRKTGNVYIYKCHAGLTEATAPIKENGHIIGYMMFGQVIDKKNRTDLINQLIKLCGDYGMNEHAQEKINSIKYKHNKQIYAASKILEACTSYIQLKEIIHLSEKSLIDHIEDFIDKHISEEITVERLCREFDISRTKLYDVTNQYISGGVASFIRQKRLQKAKNLMEAADMPIADIASAVGFMDYNYFLRVFKKTFGISPKKMMKIYRH